MIYAGIDPGLSGAIAWILPDGTWEGADAPLAKYHEKRELDAHGAAELLRRLATAGQPHGGVLVTIEAVHSMPGDGRVGDFSFGDGFGVWRGVAGALGYQLERVAPATWKKRMLDGLPPGKHSSILLAERLFKCGDWLRGPRGAELDGRAEALLLAEYGRRVDKLGGTP